MCKKDKFFQKFLTVLLAAIFLVSISVLTAAADPGDDGGVPVADDGGDYAADDGGYDTGDTPADGGYIDDGGDDSGDTPADGGYVDGGDYDSGDTPADSDSYQTPTISVPDEVRDQYEQLRDSYINGLEDIKDNISQYIPNDNLGSLPTVAPAEVVEATAEPLPDVAVSDATLFSGIIMWLCVAVGISVVAGVMVSKRTHRRGA